MKFLLTIVFILFSATSYADLEKILVQNLDLDYTSPVGKGEFEKLSFGVSLKQEQKYPVDIYRRDDSFDVVSHFIEFQWKNPLAFAHNLKEVKIEKLNLKLDRGQHYLRGNKTSFVSPQDIQFLFHRFNIVIFRQVRCEHGVSPIHTNILLKRLTQSIFLSLAHFPTV